jgi:hypothetical protein
MVSKRTWLTVLFASILVLALGGGPQPAATIQALSSAGTTAPYSGHLGDEAGQPVVDGAYDLRFELYDAPEGGSLLWSETETGVAVRGGSFTAWLGSASSLPAAAQAGKLWLAVGVRGPGEIDFTTLNPRQTFSASPSSPSNAGACPHDHWGESWSGSGNGLSLTATGIGVYAYSPSVYGVHASSPNGTGVFGSSTNGNGVHGSSAYSAGVYGSSSTGFGVHGLSSTGTGVVGKTTTTVGDTTGVWGEVASSGDYARAVVGWATNATGLSYGVWGESSSNIGVGVVGKSPSVGVVGSSPGTGVQGVSTSASGTGVYGSGSSPGWAGYFYGNVQVTGNLTKGGGGFKIDHPLDPANHYLYHSFVESPDMKNIYDGIVTLDANGEAVVTLPEWFSAVNRDVRYQLTCIGGFAPVYIAEEIQDNQFKIAGGKPGLKVSWQVTGIRQDPYAEQYRMPVEETKSPEERGLYLHPELYGQPETMRVKSVYGPSVK